MRDLLLRSDERHPVRAFSLVEVVIALGIVTFALIGLAGLMTVAAQAENTSSQTVAAANVASALIAERRAMPTKVVSGFALTNVNIAASNVSGTPLYLTSNGNLTTQPNAAYGMIYQVVPSNSAAVDLMLFWPAQASTPQTAAGRYEVATEIALPH
jgi:Tfp pilus assembly protein PilV